MKYRVFFLSCCLSAPVFAESAKEQLAETIAASDCLAANFVQVMSDTDGEVLQESRGTVSADTPRKLNWVIAAPDNQRIVSDGVTLWRYESDLDQVIISDISSHTTLPLDVLSGSPEALSQYEISVNDGVYSLIPLREGNYFNRLEITFNDANQLGSINIVDNFDQLSAITFEHQNWDCSALRQYQFEPPEGIDVIFE